MDDWGRNPNVALFVGGPKHGEIVDIGSTTEYLWRELEDYVSSFTDVLAKPVFRDYKYIRNEVYIPRDNAKLTVMYEAGLSPMAAMQTAEAEWNYRRVWNIPVALPQSYYNTLFAGKYPRPRKSPEEAVAWLHNGKGKDFL